MSRTAKGWLILAVIIVVLAFFEIRGAQHNPDSSWTPQGGDAACAANSYNC